MRLTLLAALILFSPRLFAQELLVWEPSQASELRIILPMLPNETPNEAVENYLSSLKKDSDLSRLGLHHFWRARGKFRKLESTKNSRTQVLIQTNDGFEAGNVLDLTAKSRADAFVLPPAAGIRLTAKQREAFYNKLYDGMDMRMNLGGADVHPNHYGEEITHSKKTNFTRDKFEIELIQHWQKRNSEALGNGETGKPELGFCRGHQIMAVAGGHKMYQDISLDGVGKTSDHRSPEHHSGGQRWHHIYFSESLLRRLLGNKIVVLANSVHHQAVRVNTNARTKVVAFAADKIVEAMESPDKLTMGVQFHPELSVEATQNPGFTKIANGMIRGAIAWARLNRIRRPAPRCVDVF